MVMEGVTARDGRTSTACVMRSSLHAKDQFAQNLA